MSDGPQTTSGMPFRVLGRTGERVSLIGLGGHHLGTVEDDREAIRIVRAAMDAGINFLDNYWDYHGGRSELLVGKALKEAGRRDRAFVMTKIDGQTRDAASRQIEESLRRLRVDVIDLLQFHEVIRPGDPERIFSEGGFEAVLRARDEGKVRYIGFTGHKDPAFHLKMIDTAQARGFTFDAVQMPLNVMDAHFRSFERQVLPVLVQRGIAVLGMKSLASGHILRSGRVTPIEAMHYVMNLPVSVVVCGCDSMEVLQQAVEAARTFRPLTEQQVVELLARTRDAATDGHLEPFKTTPDFDGTAQNPQWLG